MKITQEKRDFINNLTLLKVEAMRLGLYRTGHKIEIAIQEVGWDVQGLDAPEEQKIKQGEMMGS